MMAITWGTIALAIYNNSLDCLDLKFDAFIVVSGNSSRGTGILLRSITIE